MKNMSKSLADRFLEVRTTTEKLCSNLQPEDYVIQSDPVVSPPKWHLAHTSWFFDQFLLQKNGPKLPVDPHFYYLFNSYYNSVGPYFERHRRGIISRPTINEILSYRRMITE